VLLSPATFAQTPSELAELNLQEIMNLSISEPDLHSETQNRWQMSYHYQKLKLDGYRTGTRDIRKSDVLYTPPALRTASTYPVVPTEITQEVHSFRLSYQWSDTLKLGITAPYIKQSTDHISSIPNFSGFTLKSEGIGDISLNSAYTLPFSTDGKWTLLASLSLPTGSIGEQGDTPRNGAGTEELLPYTMQVGSGTYDFPLSLQFANQTTQFHYGAQVNALIRTGKNNHGYRLGNTFGFGSWLRWRASSWIQPSASINYRHNQKIHGLDKEMTVAGTYPYPANITNPNNFGGDKVDLGVSLRLCAQANGCEKYVDLNVSKAIYQNLNGIQIKEDALIGISTGLSF
jgi:hypothetical protein